MHTLKFKEVKKTNISLFGFNYTLARPRCVYKQGIQALTETEKFITEKSAEKTGQIKERITKFDRFSSTQ